MPTKRLQRLLPRVLELLPEGKFALPLEIDIVAVSTREMCRVHEEFMGDPTVTDVITFHHGEILICPAVAQAEAALHGHSYEQELLFYMIHGLLHLLGWDDRTTAQRRAMHRAQSRLLKQLF